MALYELGFKVEGDGLSEFVMVKDAAGTELGYIEKAKLEPYFTNITVELTTDASYTTAEVAALVEEIKAKTYDGVKARVLSLLEALLQAKGLGTEPAGRVLDILLRDVDRQITDVAAKHVPEITAAVLDGIREGREQAEFDAKYTNLKGRAKKLEERAESARWDVECLKRRGDNEQLEKMWSEIGGNPSPETVAAVMAILESTDKPHS